MARVGISITKSTSFRGVAQEFANTYYYNAPEPITAPVVEAAIDLIVTKEKAIHASSVTFVRARGWSAGGSEATNAMIVDKALSGAGSQSPQSIGIDKERAFLVRIRAGSDSKGRPVYLRKYWHLDVSVMGGQSISTAMMANTGQLAQASRDALVGHYNDLKLITPTGAGGNWDLCSKTGRAITGGTVAHPYLEHHQLGDQWRG